MDNFEYSGYGATCCNAQFQVTFFIKNTPHEDPATPMVCWGSLLGLSRRCFRSIFNECSCYFCCCFVIYDIHLLCGLLTPVMSHVVSVVCYDDFCLACGFATWLVWLLGLAVCTYVVWFACVWLVWLLVCDWFGLLVFSDGLVDWVVCLIDCFSKSHWLLWLFCRSCR